MLYPSLPDSFRSMKTTALQFELARQCLLTLCMGPPATDARHTVKNTQVTPRIVLP